MSSLIKGESMKEDCNCFYISEDRLRSVMFCDSLKLEKNESNQMALELKKALDNENIKKNAAFGIFLNNVNDRLLYLKYRYDGQSLFLYDYYVQDEYKEMLKITKINGYPVDTVIVKIKNFFGDNINFNDVERVLTYPRILKELGIIENDYCFTIQKDGKEYDVSLSNCSSKLDSKLFVKRHDTNALIQNFNKIESNQQEYKTDNLKVNYAYDSACKLLKILSELSVQSHDKKMFLDIYNVITNLSDIKISDDSNLDWMIISSYFLFNEKYRQKLPQSYFKYIEELPSLLFLLNQCYFLDKNNNVVGLFSKKFFERDDMDINKCIEEAVTEEEKDYYKGLKEQGFLSIRYFNLPGCNEYLLTDGELDFSKLFLSIRNSFAHSSYEVIDENSVRIYGYDIATNELDYNIIINKKLIEKLINDYEYYSGLNNVFPVMCHDIEANYLMNIDGIKNKEELEEYLKSKKILDLKKLKYADDFDYSYSANFFFIKNLIESAKENQYTAFYQSTYITDLLNLYDYKDLDIDFTERKFTDEEIKYIIDKVEKVAPQFYEHSFTSKNLIIDNIYKTKKLGTKNLNNAFLKIINSKDKSFSSLIDTLDENPTEIYDLSNYLKILIISFLNNILIYSYNGNSNINTSEFDLASIFKFDRALMTNGMLKRIQILERTISNKQHEKEKYENDYLKKQKMLSNPTYLSKAPKTSILQEQEKLESLSQLLKNWDDEKTQQEINELTIEKAKIYNRILEVENNVNAYILEHLRNSLSHGSVSFLDDFDINNISNAGLVFKDYHPITGELTFNGSIALQDLIVQFSNEKFLRSMYMGNSNFFKI